MYNENENILKETRSPLFKILYCKLIKPYYVHFNRTAVSHHTTFLTKVDLGGLGVTCSSRDQRFAGSNPAEVDDFFRA